MYCSARHESMQKKGHVICSLFVKRCSVWSHCLLMIGGGGCIYFFHTRIQSANGCKWLFAGSDRKAPMWRLKEKEKRHGCSICWWTLLLPPNFTARVRSRVAFRLLSVNLIAALPAPRPWLHPVDNRIISDYSPRALVFVCWSKQTSVDCVFRRLYGRGRRPRGVDSNSFHKSGLTQTLWLITHVKWALCLSAEIFFHPALLPQMNRGAAYCLPTFALPMTVERRPIQGSVSASSLSGCWFFVLFTPRHRSLSLRAFLFTRAQLCTGWFI